MIIPFTRNLCKREYSLEKKLKNLNNIFYFYFIYLKFKNKKIYINIYIRSRIYYFKNITYDKNDLLVMIYV